MYKCTCVSIYPLTCSWVLTRWCPPDCRSTPRVSRPWVAPRCCLWCPPCPPPVSHLPKSWLWSGPHQDCAECWICTRYHFAILLHKRSIEPTLSCSKITWTGGAPENFSLSWHRIFRPDGIGQCCVDWTSDRVYSFKLPKVTYSSSLSHNEVKMWTVLK